MAQFRINHPWDPGYALPDYIMAEPPGRGTLTTAQLPRRTIGASSRKWTGGYTLPQYVQAEPHGRGVIESYDTRRKSIPHFIPPALGSSDGGIDPFKDYGQQGAKYLLRTLVEVPEAQRQLALEAFLDKLEPGLWSRVAAKSSSFEDAGMRPAKAIEAALAQSLTEGFKNEIIRLGEGTQSTLSGYSSVGGIRSWTSKKLASFGGKTTEWGGKAVSAFSNAACSILSNPAGRTAATVYSFGGAQAGVQMCGGGLPGMPMMMPPLRRPAPLAPIVIGAVALFGVIWYATR